MSTYTDVLEALETIFADANVRYQIRRGLAADWTTDNPVLAQGELGLETDTMLYKLGDGMTSWTSLPHYKFYPTSTPVKALNWQPIDNGLVGANDNPSVFSATSALLTASTTYVKRVYVYAGRPIGHLLMHCITASSSDTAGYYAALYDANGNLIPGTGTADFAVSWRTTGVMTIAFGASYTPSVDGYIYVVVRTGTATTQPKVAPGPSSVLTNAGLTSNLAPGAALGLRTGTTSSAWSGATPPATLANIVTTSDVTFFVGLQA